MAIVTLLPDGTTTLVGWTVVGAATAHAALSDASDATYITDTVAGTTAQGHTAKLTFATTTLPSGAVIKKITPKFRASQATGTQPVGPLLRIYKPYPPSQFLYGPYDSSQHPTSSIQDFTNNTAGGAYLHSPDPLRPQWDPQFLVDNLILTMGTNVNFTAPTGTDDHRIYKVWLDVEYNEQPVATSLALDPAGANTVTTQPGFTWLCSDPEGDPQTGRRVVLWLTADFNDANCPDANAVSFVAADGTTRTSIAHTGSATDPTEYSSSNSWACPVDLLATGAYTLCVQLADTVGDQVRFANSAGTGTFSFTMAITSPPTPVLSGVAWDQANYRTGMTVQAANNLLSADAADNETGLALAWVGDFNPGPAPGGTDPVQSATFADGGTFSRRWATGGFTGVDSSIASERFLVKAGSVLSAHVRGRDAVNGRNWNVELRFYDAADAQIGSSFTGSNVAVTNTGFTTVTVLNKTAPALTVWGRLFVRAVAGATGDLHYVDRAGVYPGAALPGAWTRGGLVSSQRIVVERSTDGGTTWYGLPQCTGLVGGPLADGSTNQLATIYDLANRHNVAARYRAKTTHNDGTYSYQSAYTATGGPVTPSFDQFILRDPTDSTVTLVVPVAGPIESVSVERVGVFEVVFQAAPVFVSQVVGTEKMTVPVKLTGEAQWLTLQALRAKMVTLILQTDMDGVAWWVRLGPQVSHQLVYSTLRRTASTRPRFADLELIVSNGPNLGQPLAGVVP